MDWISELNIFRRYSYNDAGESGYSNEIYANASGCGSNQILAKSGANARMNGGSKRLKAKMALHHCLVKMVSVLFRRNDNSSRWHSSAIQSLLCRRTMGTVAEIEFIQSGTK
jgi:hypothetical protein